MLQVLDQKITETNMTCKQDNFYA